jgi:hypothetical protein
MPELGTVEVETNLPGLCEESVNIGILRECSTQIFDTQALIERSSDTATGICMSRLRPDSLNDLIPNTRGF